MDAASWLSQSPFGFWGEWNFRKTKTAVPRRIVTIAFRLLGGLEPHASRVLRLHINNSVTIAFRLLGGLELIPVYGSFSYGSSHNRLSAFGGIGTENGFSIEILEVDSHNRLSAFGVIGTVQGSAVTGAVNQVTIAFRLSG